jgi:tetratricopeptide (TPR) repeat protein
MARLPSSRTLILMLTLLAPLCLLALQDQQPAPKPLVPDPKSSAHDLEEQGDLLRAQKRFLDSLDFYNAAIAKQPTAILWNKEGMSYLMLQRYQEASKCFAHAIKTDKKDPDGYNNQGFMEYRWKQDYSKALKYYRKALLLRPNDAVIHYNMGSAYFAQRDYVRSAQEYRAAYNLDPDIFERVSKTGVMAQSGSPENRAAFSFMVAKMFAQAGDLDRSLEYLRKALEDGYKDIKKVYTESEFAALREDKRFSELMAQKPQPIQ